MERNTLLAIALSIAVLFVYQGVFPSKHLPKSAQVTVNNTVADKSPRTAIASPEVDKESTQTVKKTVDYTISNPKTAISYTNVGGSLQKIDFLGNSPFPVTDILSIKDFDNAPFSGQKSNGQTVALSYKGKNWLITKTYAAQDQNFIKVRVEIKNISGISILNDLNFNAFEIDESDGEISQNSRENALLEYSVYADGKIFRKGTAIKFNAKNDRSAAANIHWIGFRDHYHALVIKPEFDTKGYAIHTDNAQRLNISFQPKEQSIAPGQSINYDFSIYAGPQNPGQMRKYHKGFEKIIAFSSFAPIEWIAQGIYYTMPFFHTIFRSWGVAIILMSSLIYGMTYPLTIKSMMSMRKMQEAQPKINALRERHKNDPQKLNAEMIEIYRREKINPFGGCLPMLIQMPFFMALYQILWRAQYFQSQGFLWIKDLSQPDRLMILPFYLPFFGNELNILPVLTGGVMFLQQRLTSKNMVVTDEQQAMQQKMMMYVLPVMMVCMFYHFASAWAIYFLVFYICSTFTQWKVTQLSGKK